MLLLPNLRAPALLVPVLLAPGWLWGAGEGVKQPVVTTDLLKIRRVTDVEVAPDGAFAVFAVQSIQTDPPPAAGGDPVYGYRSHLFYIDLNNEGLRFRPDWNFQSERDWMINIPLWAPLIVCMGLAAWGRSRSRGMPRSSHEANP